ncbi:hypothetical protein AVEN_111879-1 [Araneus ventricosus]|uniref:Uncharacterized protein n=1 Tax=Araneus ventricosus TaxID=182803 RepID=A0A4Y2BX28_ARAVE|nr:hypothetical protein AVEN_111879-1 [Araneus ventricosus]
MACTLHCSTKNEYRKALMIIKRQNVIKKRYQLSRRLGDFKKEFGRNSLINIEISNYKMQNKAYKNNMTLDFVKFCTNGSFFSYTGITGNETDIKTSSLHELNEPENKSKHRALD